MKRLYFFTQEIVIFREDLVNRMRRNCIVPPDENNEPDVSKHVSLIKFFTPNWKFFLNNNNYNNNNKYFHSTNF